MEPRGVAIESVSLQGNRGLAVFSLSILMSIISKWGEGPPGVCLTYSAR